jgi:hypothetical protein
MRCLSNPYLRIPVDAMRRLLKDRHAQRNEWRDYLDHFVSLIDLILQQMTFTASNDPCPR